MIVNTSSMVVDSDGGTKLAVYTGNEATSDVVDATNEAAIVNNSEAAGETASELVDEAVADEVQKPFDEARFWAEIALIGKMADLARDREEIASELAEAKSEWERLKDKTSQSRETMSDLEVDLKDKTDEFMQVAMELCSVARGNALKDFPANSMASDVSDVVDPIVDKIDDGWRLHPTAELLKGIKGNKAKKELVVEAAPTIGHLEDIRGEASKECVSFNAKLPKGCGKGFAQSIEDLLVEFIGKWVAQRSNPEVSIKADELLAEIRAASQQNGWTKEDFHPKETDSHLLRAGFSAFNEGRPFTDVVVDDLNAAKQWMIGWVGGEFLSK